MKVHYINILLFALPLIILVKYPKNPCTTLYTRINKPTKPHRLLCECQLYAPQNYDNDPEMKKVMENFGRKTSQRFEEYNERMIKNKQKCKDQCYKDVQKIILKDKIEKELTEKLSTLQTDISTDEIPTCVCKKSLADKVEKTCLRCTQNLGGIVAPSSGVLGGISELALSEWNTGALLAAVKAAMVEGAAKGLAEGIKEGIKIVMDGLNTDFGLSTQAVQKIGLVINAQNYKDAGYIYQVLYKQYEMTCVPRVTGVIRGAGEPICTNVEGNFFSGNGASMQEVIKKKVETMVLQAETTAGATTEAVTEEAIATLTDLKTGAVNATYSSCQTAIIASIAAIVVIVLVMVIIYLILRYRRKSKMKKKLHYIKLLKE
ncbi:PIR protein, putative [Plasmodium sp.]|nr:PIR protein, putative [Plasmodium sp.]